MFTHWKDNVKKEKEHTPFSKLQIEKQLSSLFGVNNINVASVDDEYLQRRGVDFIADVEGKLITIDAKVRVNVEKYWGDNSQSQDIAIEYSQSGGHGWANHPNYVTDYVLWAFPGLENSKYKDSIILPHAFCQWLTTGAQLEIILNDISIPKRKGKNQAGCYSYFFCLNLEQVKRLLSVYFSKF